MAERPQVSVRVDSELLEAIKEKCKAEDITLTEFCVSAFKAALGDTYEDSGRITPEVIESRVTELLAPFQQRLEALEEIRTGELVA